MNKKNIFLILVLMIFLSVMAMSVLGKQAEEGGVIQAESIALFKENGEEIGPNEKVAEMEIICKEEDKVSLNISVVISPENTTDTSLQVRFPEQKDEESIRYTELTDESTYYVNKAGKEVHSNKYKYNIEFVKNSLCEIYFYYNNEGGIASYRGIKFIFTINGSEDKPIII